MLVRVKDAAPKSHHDLCVDELVTTEENYVKCLTMLTQVVTIYLSCHGHREVM